MATIVMNAEQYEGFFSVISMIKDTCIDIDLVKGVIRQRSDNEFVLYEIDLSDIMGDVDLPMMSIKPKIDLMKMFINSDEITIETNDNVYSFKDEFSKFTVTSPSVQFINNHFTSIDELSQMYNFDDRRPVLNYTFTQKMFERMRIIASNYNTLSFSIEFLGETAVIKATPPSMDQSAIIANNIPLDFVINDKITNITTLFFLADHDGDMELSMQIDKDDVFVSEMSTSIKGVNYKIHNRSRLMDN